LNKKLFQELREENEDENEDAIRSEDEDEK